MDDYSRIAHVIEHLDAHHTEQPSLGELAALVGLSESHFHRLFQRWVGTTPKDFLQFLTAEHAKQLLQNSNTVFDAAIDSGLSGPGRLHDLFVSLEAVTPGEYRQQGRGLNIEHGDAETPFGRCHLAWTDRGICHLEFVNDAPSILHEHWKNAEFTTNSKGAEGIANSIFSRDTPEPKLKTLVRGTPFQLKVWRALLRIPEGSTTTYSTIAEMIGKPGAARAVGTACGSNTIGYLIPCHRVIRQTGIVTGYRWGTVRKKALLAWESAHFTQTTGLIPKTYLSKTGESG